MFPAFLAFLRPNKPSKPKSAAARRRTSTKNAGSSSGHHPQRRTNHRPGVTVPLRLGEILIRENVVTREQLNEALDEQRRQKTPVGEFLVRKGHLTPEKLERYLQLQVTEQGGSAPGHRLPPLPSSVNDFAFLFGAVLYVASGRGANPAIRTWQIEARRRGVEVLVKQCDMEKLAELRSSLSSADVRLRAGLPAIRRFRGLVADAVTADASDISLHLVSNDGAGYMDVLFRVNGDLVKHGQHTEEEGEMMIRSIFAAMSDVADAQIIDDADQSAVINNPAFLRGEDGRALPLSGLRIAKSKLTTGHGVSVRLLYQSKEDASRDPIGDLGYSERQKQDLRYLARLTHGVSMFTGPTGSGKSTTLAAEIQIIKNTRKGVKIITIEDPAEYKFSDTRIWQYYITNSDRGKHVFADKLKISLRQDPDIIMVGEIRDQEVAKQALTAAITGHQVWTTLHVTEPLQSITRLKAMDVEEYLLRDHKLIRAICGQRLLKQLCPDCSEPLSGNEHLYEPQTLEHLKTWTKGTPFNGLDRVRVPGKNNRCKSCGGTGYARKRTAAAQIIRTDAWMLEGLLDRGATFVEQKYLARNDAAPSMQAHGVLKILDGRVDILSVEAVLDPLEPRPEHMRELTMEDL